MCNNPLKKSTISMSTQKVAQEASSANNDTGNSRPRLDLSEDDSSSVVPLSESGNENHPTPHGGPTNESVLNFAFVTFLGFTTLQFFFAVIAHSQSMMADCAAMYVDVVTYLFNYLAERLKHGHSGMSSRELRLHRLYMELIPPFISVTTLVGVTIVALQQAVRTLVQPPPSGSNTQPDIQIMLLFSGLNMILDLLNVSCFARVDQAVGIPGGYHQHNNDNKKEESVATEVTPLITSDDGDTTHADDDNDDFDSLASSEATGILNLNMCSAWTHICADTLRSVAVLIAAGLAYVFPALVSPMQADSYGAIIVSGIILVSLAPLVKGLYGTARKIQAIWNSGVVNEASHQQLIDLVV